MAAIPELVSKEWENREGPIVLATVSAEGTPNAIYASCVSKFGEDILLVADNFFFKTRANIEAGSPASLLFLTKESKSYQIKGTIELLAEGELFEDMKKWNPERLPGNAAAVLRVEEVYSGSEKLL